VTRGGPRVRARRDARRASRERDRLTKEQTAHTSRIKALLRLLGMAVGNPSRRDFLGWLSAQRDWRGRAVPRRMLAEIRHEHARLMLVREQLEALAQAAAQVDLPPAAAQMVERSELLLRLKCLGPAFATTLTSEVFYKDFRNRREVASYFGLTPSPWQSGGIDRDQGISKAGNPRARRSAIELAWLWLRHQPDSKLTREYRRRTLDASKRIKRFAIVALARKLMVALWRYLTTGLVPEGAVLKAAVM
jgi:transposase